MVVVLQLLCVAESLVWSNEQVVNRFTYTTLSSIVGDFLLDLDFHGALESVGHGGVIWVKRGIR